MHRSGTSLTANLLKESGLFIGNNLMTNGFDNKKGHFEDLELLEIHELDLKIKGFDTRALKGDIPCSLFFEEETENNILSLLESRKSLKLWGWKEPRTTLYLQAWIKLVPSIKCIAVYRNYDEVASSLIRRYQYKLKNGVGMSPLIRLKHYLIYAFYIFYLKREAYKFWVTYNEAILQFAKKYPENILVFELSHFLKNYNETLDVINSKFGSSLKQIQIESILDLSLMNANFNSTNIKWRFFPKGRLESVMKKLNGIATWISA